jgi:hypothetical protein
MPAPPNPSTAIADIDYDSDARELHVKFHSGPHTYVVPDVTPDQHRALLAAGSHGQHYAQFVRKAGIRKLAG